MPAESKSQQRLMGMAHAYEKGDLNIQSLPKSLQSKIKSLSRNMESEDIKDYAETKHKNLPEKKGSLQMKYFTKLGKILRRNEDGSKKVIYKDQEKSLMSRVINPEVTRYYGSAKDNKGHNISYLTRNEDRAKRLDDSLNKYYKDSTSMKLTGPKRHIFGYAREQKKIDRYGVVKDRISDMPLVSKTKGGTILGVAGAAIGALAGSKVSKRLKGIAIGGATGAAIGGTYGVTKSMSDESKRKNILSKVEDRISKLRLGQAVYDVKKETV